MPSHSRHKMGRALAWGSLFLALVAILMARRLAAQAVNCDVALIRLAPCLPFLQNRAESPLDTCCERFATVVQNSSKCLCGVLNGDPLPFGVIVNQTQSLALPKACNVTTPPVSACNRTSTPPTSAPSPTSPPSAPSPTSSPSASPGPQAKTSLTLEPTPSREANSKTTSPQPQVSGAAWRSSTVALLVASAAAFISAAPGVLL